MWNQAYSFVRLHQPHGMFTVGNIGWTLGREPGYLATRDEVAAHLRHCLEVIADRIEIDARWGWDYRSHVEDARGVTIHAQDPDGSEHTFRAERFVNATGFDVEVCRPLALRSERVRSIAPEHLEESGLLTGADPAVVWVVGSGKTAMDTTVALLSARPGRTSTVGTAAPAPRRSGAVPRRPQAQPPAAPPDPGSLQREHRRSVCPAVKGWVAAVFKLRSE